jgi:uncharacterized protein YjbI with pentapeptide repeats
LKLLTETPFKFAPLVGRIGFPAHSLTLIVKGTFRILPGRPAQLADEQLLPTGDEYYADDEEMQQSCRYESDFAPFKPRADLLLVGKCHTPEETPIGFCRVRFQVGTRGKALDVVGERLQNGALARSTDRDPEPFTQMELRYENSFGGEGYEKNPVGKGYVISEGGEQVQLPNILQPNVDRPSPNAQPEPAGFGPLGRMWEQRFSKLGTYDNRWLQERWPWFPEDLDWAFFNASPPDMQAEGYLRGDETLYFENLHPVHSQYRSRLPGVRVRCFLNELPTPGKGGDVFHEVGMNLDTLWVDMDSERLVLVWRGVSPVTTEDHEEVQDVFIVSERVSELPKTLEHYQAAFLQQLRAREEEESFQAEEPAETEEEEEAPDEELAKIEAEANAALVAAGVDPDETPVPSEESKAAEAQLLRDLGITDEQEPTPLTRELVQARVAGGDDFAGEDLSGIDFTGFTAPGVGFQGAIMAGVRLEGADLSGADLTGANLVGADLSGALLVKASLKEADLTGANLAGANLTDAVMEGAIFDRASMPGARLDEALARDASFVEADLTRASAKNAAFPGADLSRAILTDADLRGCNLREVSIEGALAQHINLADADLTELRASEGADFSRGSFRRAIGLESIWEGSILREADFSYARLDRADFTSASLERANFHAASLKRARFLKGKLREATFTSVNLFEGMLERADLTRADLRRSNLYGAEFLNAVYDGVLLDSANLKMTKLAPR